MIDNSEKMESSSEPIEKIDHSKKYKRFIITSSVILVLSRVMSLGYIYVITKVVDIPDKILATMQFMALSQSVLISVIPFGISYAASQWTLGEFKGKDTYLEDYYAFSIYVTLPLLIVSTLGVWIFFSTLGDISPYMGGTFSVNMILYLLANLFAMVQQLFVKVELARYKNDVAVIINASYSILTSIFVPLIFFVFQRNLTSVLLAWVISSGIVILVNLRNQLPIIKLRVDLKLWKEMLVFSFPIYLVIIVNVVNSSVDQFFIFGNYNNSLEYIAYTWVTKLIQIGSQFSAIFLTGVYSMLVILKKEDILRFHNISRSLFKIVGLIGFAIYLGMIANAYFIIDTLVPKKYAFAIEWLKILSYISILNNLVNYLVIRYQVDEKRTTILLIRVLSVVIRISIAVFLIDMKVNGLLIGIYFSSVITVFLQVFFAEELRNWKMNHFLRYAGFAAIGMLAMYLTDHLTVWPYTNGGLIIVAILGVIIKPINDNDRNYIMKVVPVRLKKYASPFINLITH